MSQNIYMNVSCRQVPCLFSEQSTQKHNAALFISFCMYSRNIHCRKWTLQKTRRKKTELVQSRVLTGPHFAMLLILMLASFACIHNLFGLSFTHSLGSSFFFTWEEKAMNFHYYKYSAEVLILHLI